MRTPAIVLLLATALIPVAAARGQDASPPSSSAPPKAVSRGLTLEEAQAWHGRHPRLLIKPTDLAGLRARRETAPYNHIYDTLLARADGHLNIDPADVGKAAFRGRDQMPHILERLALAGLLTGDRKYSRKAVVLMTALGEQGFPYHGRGVAGAGDLAVGLALAYDWTYEFMTAAEQRTIQRQLAALAMELESTMAADGSAYGKLAHQEGMAGHHVVALAGGGLGLMALGLRGEVNYLQSNSWQATADDCLRGYYRDALGSDGAGLEGFELTTYALHAALPYTIVRRDMDHVDLADGMALCSVPSWAAYELLPGPAVLPAGESSGSLGGEDAMALMFAACPENGLYAWLYEATHGNQGKRSFGLMQPDFCAGDVMTLLTYPANPTVQAPSQVLPLGKQFPSCGLTFFRSGWNDPQGDVVVAFRCLPRVHMGCWHLDVNQFTLNAYGVGWAIDSGPGWELASGEPALTETVSSAAHNLFQIDGRNATSPRGRMLAFVDDKDWGLVVGDGSEAMQMATFRRYLAVGKRDGRARYVIVIDEIDHAHPSDPSPSGDAPAAHEYRHFLHTAAGNKVDVSGRVAALTASGGATGQFAVIAPADATLEVSPFKTYAMGEHPRIEARHKTSGRFYFVAALVPRAAGDERPVAIRPEGRPGNAVAFRVTADGVTDRICVLTTPDARPPEGFGTARHRLQLTHGAFKQSLLFDLEEPGHDTPSAGEPSGPLAEP